MDFTEKFEELEFELAKMEKDIGHRQKVCKFLEDLQKSREEEFAYTGTMPNESVFQFKVETLGDQVTGEIGASLLLKLLTDNQSFDEYYKLKSKIEQIKGLLS